MAEELKPCPFCGGEVRIALMKDDVCRWFVTRSVSAESCSCRVFMESRSFDESYSKEQVERIKSELVDAWNRRAERTCRDKADAPQSFLCSRCGWFETDVDGLPLEYAYCPNCGARVER